MNTIENLNTMVVGKKYAGWILDHDKHSSNLSTFVLIEITENGEYIIATNVGYVIFTQDHKVIWSKHTPGYNHFSGGRYSIVVYENEEEEKEEED